VPRGFLKMTTIDEEGRKTIVHRDAYGRVVRETRFLGGSEVGPG
jgi:YD repeat-containing protein